ncbi:MAG TPA: helix-turn-helix domain-containing protein [Deltaproteobacteria bacterium]|jgi:cytoskeleton protein RodZ|nr:helix-turn-helix domain-containing protein [Deltaproteobacteria bacterium]
MLKAMNTEKPTHHEEASSIDLKAIRQRKGLSLKDISYQSRISVSVLEAIENREFHLLPEPVYTRGFIKTYAQTLEINDEEILSAYNAYIDELEFSQQQIQIERKTEKSRLRHTIFGVVVAILIAIFIIYIMSRDYRQETVGTTTSSAITDELQEAPLVPPQPKEEASMQHQETAPPEAAEEATAEAVTVDEPVLENSTGDPETDAFASAETVQQAEIPVMSSEQGVREQEIGYILEIDAKELTWLKITEDFKPNEEILMKPGERITRKASERFIVFIGNAGGVNVSFQGKPLGPLGEKGKVVRLILPDKQGNNER